MKESRIINIIAGSSIILLLIGALFIWQNDWLSGKLSTANILESSKEKIEELSLLKLIPQIAGFSGEKTYLLLFQNNLELRPSGGYIGNFGIIKIDKGQIKALELHDTNIFDGFGKIQTDPPEPMEKYLYIKNWQMRDGNWSPDFPIAAQQVEYFYHLQGGQEEFDGIIGINAAVLPDLLELTGPIYLSEFDKEFKSDDVLYELEYEIEKGYVQRNIASGDRKTIFKKLVNETFNQLIEKNIWQKSEFRNLAIKELEEKNILLFFKDDKIQGTIAKFNWDGKINDSYEGDYLMLVEANLGGRKSNAFIEREVEYSIDFTKEKPAIKLKIKYTHQGKQKDWFNHDYRCYLRVYTPLGSWLANVIGVEDETLFREELNKTVFGNFIKVPVGQERIVEFNYLLPENIAKDYQYKLLVQKQPGIDKLPLKLLFKDSQKDYSREEIITKDLEILD